MEPYLLLAGKSIFRRLGRRKVFLLHYNIMYIVNNEIIAVDKCSLP